MDVTDEQKRRISGWINEGAKLADIQRRLAEEENVHLTYMEVRFLVDDLKLTPKDAEKTETPVEVGAASSDIVPSSAASSHAGESATAAKLADGGALPSPGKVAVTVDEITRPGALVSGNVRFSDGKKAAWYLDQMGRLGMVPEEQGYRPPQSDVAEFQLALEKELTRLGM
ncbi:MAG TPA: hypothetical protein VFV83_06650 [Chthoniobacteraceae bacterium]|nr:hypothetical protein [Chthoniobacteraceae bacterium]